jgi:hypothetical protein
VVEDERALGGRLAVVVRRSVLDPVEDHLGGRAEQHDRVEPVVELALVRHAAGDEERSLVFRGEELGHPVLAPEPLVLPHSLQAGESVSTTRKPRRPSSASALDLPVPDMPVTKTLLTSATY